MNKLSDRRKFLFKAGASGVAIVAAQSLVGGAAFGAELVAVDPNGAQAMALGYVTDGTTTDTKKFERYQAGQECVNCQLYQGAPDAESGGCLLFAGQSVTARGWCNSWVLKAS